MNDRIYLDGCSYVYGLGLSRDKSLGALLHASLDNSRPAKSNIAIADDLYSAINEDFDLYVVGYTFSSRYSFLVDNTPIDISPTKDEFRLETEANEVKLKQLHSLYYYFSDLAQLDRRSDYLVDSSIALLEQSKKRFVMFSWEQRNLINSNKLFYPRKMMSTRYNQSKTNHHLTTEGMQVLATIIKGKL